MEKYKRPFLENDLHDARGAVDPARRRWRPRDRVRLDWQGFRSQGNNETRAERDD